MALELVTPTLIENTTMHKYINSAGEFKTYRIKANDGYVLHDKDLDTDEFDENFEPTGNVILGYTTGTCSCGANYDFTANTREFYAVLADTVPADQIFSGGNNDHEIM